MRFIVNGVERELDVPPHRLLSELLHDLGLNVPPAPCCDGECGAGMVLVDGMPVEAGLTLAWRARGRAVETAEGLAPPGSPVARAFAAAGADACPHCTPGVLVAAAQALRVNPWITEDEARAALMGNLCRCGGYVPQVAAILAAAGEIQTGGGA